MKFRTQYTPHKADVFATDVGEDEGLVQQSMRDECDVNVIMARYQQTGELTHIQSKVAEYGDYSDVLDYRDGLHHIMAADAMFMELPAKVRDRFGNDPAEFIEFASDPKNLEEMRDMGLAPKHAPSGASEGGARTSSFEAKPTSPDIKSPENPG